MFATVPGGQMAEVRTTGLTPFADTEVSIVSIYLSGPWHCAAMPLVRILPA